MLPVLAAHHTVAVIASPNVVAQRLYACVSVLHRLVRHSAQCSWQMCPWIIGLFATEPSPCTSRILLMENISVQSSQSCIDPRGKGVCCAPQWMNQTNEWVGSVFPASTFPLMACSCVPHLTLHSHTGPFLCNLDGDFLPFLFPPSPPPPASSVQQSWPHSNRGNEQHLVRLIPRSCKQWANSCVRHFIQLWNRKEINHAFPLPHLLILASALVLQDNCLIHFPENILESHSVQRTLLNVNKMIP